EDEGGGVAQALLRRGSIVGEDGGLHDEARLCRLRRVGARAGGVDLVGDAPPCGPIVLGPGEGQALVEGEVARLAHAAGEGAVGEWEGGVRGLVAVELAKGDEAGEAEGEVGNLVAVEINAEVADVD